jgi:hypothetical protein
MVPPDLPKTGHSGPDQVKVGIDSGRNLDFGRTRAVAVNL